MRLADSEISRFVDRLGMQIFSEIEFSERELVGFKKLYRIDRTLYITRFALNQLIHRVAPYNAQFGEVNQGPSEGYMRVMGQTIKVIYIEGGPHTELQARLVSSLVAVPVDNPNVRLQRFLLNDPSGGDRLSRQECVRECDRMVSVVSYEEMTKSLTFAFEANKLLNEMKDGKAELVIHNNQKNQLQADINQ